MLSSTGTNSIGNTYLNMNGTGSLLLSGANTFTGIAAINSGSIVLQNALALQDAIVQINTNNGLNLNGLANVTVAGLANGGSLNLGSTNLTVGIANGSFGYSGVLSGTTTGGLTVQAGSQTLYGSGSSIGFANVQQGNLTVGGGSLTLTGTGTPLNVVNGASMNVSGGGVVNVTAGTFTNVDGASNPSLTVSGAGSTLNANFETVIGYGQTGTLNVNQGGAYNAGTYLIAGFDGPGSGSATPGSGTINVASGGSVSAPTVILGYQAGATGAAAVDGAGSSLTATGSLNLGGLSSTTLGETGTLSITNGGSVVVAGTTNLWTASSSITINGGTLTTGLLSSNGAVGSIALNTPFFIGPTALAINGSSGSATYAGTITGGGDLVKSGGSIETLSGANTLSGFVTINGGSIVLGNAQALQDALVVINTNNGLNLNGYANVTLGGLGGSGSLNLGATNLTVGTANIGLGYGGTLSATTGGLIFQAGEEALNGSGSSIGYADVQQGDLFVLGGSLALTSSNIPLLVGNNASMTVESQAVVDTTAGTFTIVDGASNPSLTIRDAGSTLNAGFETVIGYGQAGSLNVNQGGAYNAGTYLIAGFQGTSSGTINVASGGAINAPIVVLGYATGTTGAASVDGAGSKLTASSSLDLGGYSSTTLGGTGTLSVTNGGAVVAGTTNFWTAGSSITVNGGTLTTGLLSSNGAVGSIALTDPANGTALTINGASGSATYAGTIAGTGSLAKSGGSTETLSGTNAFAGSVTVTGGTLEMTNGVATSYQAGGGTLKLDYGAFGSDVVLEADAGGKIIINAPTVIGGILIGTGTDDVSAVSKFIGTQITNGVSIAPANNATLLGVTSAGNITNAAGQTLTWNGGSNAGGTLTVNGIANLSGFTSSGILQVNPGGVVNDSNTNLVLLGGSRTYLGSATSLGGAITLSNGATIELNGALLVNNGRINGTTDVNYGSMAKGAGVYGAVNVNSGGVFSPGNSPGSVTTGTATWGAGGAYLVELNQASGTVGVNSDFWNIQGQLNIAAGSTTNGAFTIDLSTLNSSDNPAPLSDFDASKSYTWEIAAASGGIVGFDPSLFALDTSGFLNPTNGGHFSVIEVGNQIDVTFSASPASVPEPSSLALTGTGAAALLAAALRRRATVRRRPA